MNRIVKVMIFIPTVVLMLCTAYVPHLNASEPVMIVTNKESVYVRSGPAFYYPVIKNIYASSLKVIEKGIWYSVEYLEGGETCRGYVYGKTFNDDDFYETGSLSGICIGIDPDGQMAADASPEQLGKNMNEYVPGMTESARGVNTGEYEYNICYDVAVKLSFALINEGARVVLTRTSSAVNMSNRARIDYLNKQDCDLVIRLSCNYSDNSTLKGVRVDHAGNEENIAEKLASELSTRLRLNNNGALKTQSSTFLNWSDTLAVSVEMGYLSNQNDEKILTSAAYRYRIASCIHDVVMDIYNVD